MSVVNVRARELLDTGVTASRAIGHPLRVQILNAVAERVVSPSDLAAEWGEPIGNVSYHVRTLHRLGALTLVRTKQVRGAVEHYYRARVAIEPIKVTVL